MHVYSGVRSVRLEEATRGSKKTKKTSDKQKEINLEMYYCLLRSGLLGILLCVSLWYTLKLEFLTAFSIRV